MAILQEGLISFCMIWHKKKASEVVCARGKRCDVSQREELDCVYNRAEDDPTLPPRASLQNSIMRVIKTEIQKYKKKCQRNERVSLLTMFLNQTK
jgi:hypothetical protein